MISLNNGCIKIYKVFYKYYNQISKNIYSVRVPVAGSDTMEMVEYAWRMSPANVTNAYFIGAEIVN